MFNLNTAICMIGILDGYCKKKKKGFKVGKVFCFLLVNMTVEIPETVTFAEVTVSDCPWTYHTHVHEIPEACPVSQL